MRKVSMFATAVLLAAFSIGCEKKETAVDKAVDRTKDALDMREHEKLKDAGEDAKKAVQDAGEAVKDEAHAHDN